MTYTIPKYAAALGCAILAIGGCKDSTSVPDLNNPPSPAFYNTLTSTNLPVLVNGILNQERAALDYPFLVFPATMSRDIIYLTGTESRFISETLEGRPSPGGFLARGYSPYYTAVHAENSLLSALTRSASDITPGTKLAVSGFVRTLRTNDLYRVLETRDTLGIPVNVADSTQLAPIQCKPSALASLSAALDSADNDLQAALAAGVTTFPTPLPAGFTSIGGDYSSIANLINYNRGLKGKIEVYRGLATNSSADFAAAKVALDSALAGVGTDAASLAGGPYYQFSTASGDVTNPLYDPSIHFQPSVFDSLETGDLRGSKIITRAKAISLKVDGVTFTTKYDPAVTVTSDQSNQTRPIPILKNEELYLLRAQAEIGLNDLASATADLNVVRTTSGGLAPYPVFTSETDAINALLYEKRYSLLTDGPQRLVDLRAYGRLNATTFPPGTQLSPYPNDPFNYVLPYAQAEIDARGGVIKCQ